MTREEVLARAKVRRDRQRQRAIEALGGRCVCCGESTPEFLELDHVDPRGGRFDRKNLGISQAELQRRVSMGARNVELRCSNCHRVKSRGQVCPHQR